MSAPDSCRPDTVGCPLYRDRTIISQPVLLPGLTQLYVQESIKFIQVWILQTTYQQQLKDFLLRLQLVTTRTTSSTSPSTTRTTPRYSRHRSLYCTTPGQFAGPAHRNVSARGSFGDSVCELDWAVGQLQAAVAALGQTDNTLVSSAAVPCWAGLL